MISQYIKSLSSLMKGRKNKSVEDLKVIDKEIIMKAYISYGMIYPIFNLGGDAPESIDGLVKV